MEFWFGLFIWILVPTFIITQVVARKSQAKRLRKMWPKVAETYGWQYIPSHSYIKARIAGNHQGRDFEIVVYVNYQIRNAPKVYTEITLPVETVKGIILRSNWPSKMTLSSIFRSTEPRVGTIKSGDAIFDNSFGFKGTPIGQAEVILHSNDVRAAIRQLYPMNAAIFEPPTLILEGQHLRLRTYRLHEQEDALYQFVMNSCHLAATVEAALA